MTSLSLLAGRTVPVAPMTRSDKDKSICFCFHQFSFILNKNSKVVHKMRVGANIDTENIFCFYSIIWRCDSKHGKVRK